MDREQLLEKLRETGVVQNGHFLLTSGLHSDTYLQCALILQHPPYAEELGQALASLFKDQEITLVIGPALGGVILAHEVARALGVSAIFAERRDGIMGLQRGFSISSEDRVLVVEDVVTTGVSVAEVLNLIEDRGGETVGVGTIIDRSQGRLEFSQPFKSLIRLNIQVYSPQDCPMCKDGLPFVKPGSREERK